MTTPRNPLTTGLTVLFLSLLAACATHNAPQGQPDTAQQAAAPAAEAQKPAAPVEKIWPEQTFKVCADPNNPPYSDKTGGGFENKIAELLAAALGKPVEYYWFPQRMGFIRKSIKEQLTSGEYRCDIIMGYPTGAEMLATTKPYYRSTYALVYVKGRGFDDIKSPQDLANLPEARKNKLKLAMFDSSPATTWLMRHGLVGYAKPYQTMGGDAAVNTAERLEKDMKEGKLDMAIIWGPIAGWLQYHNKIGPVALIPMRTETLETGKEDKEGKFEFPISMAVRIPDKGRKALLNDLIEQKADAVRGILQTYHVPLVD